MTSERKNRVGKAFEQPADNPDDEVTGHKARFFDAEQAVPQPDDDEVEVEGHLISPLNPELARNRTNDRLADAERARRAEGLNKSRDGGMLDKIRRRIDNA